MIKDTKLAEVKFKSKTKIIIRTNLSGMITPALHLAIPYYNGYNGVSVVTFLFTMLVCKGASCYSVLRLSYDVMCNVCKCQCVINASSSPLSPLQCLPPGRCCSVAFLPSCPSDGERRPSLTLTIQLIPHNHFGCSKNPPVPS